MRFMYIVTPVHTTPPTPELMDAVHKLAEREIKAGRMINSGALQPRTLGAQVRITDGKLGVIDDPKTLDAMPLKLKAISLHWELMFTRSLFETPDMIRQHEILERIAALIDAGTLRTTLGEHFGAINADNLRRAHALIESNRARGKIVLEGF